MANPASDPTKYELTVIAGIANFDGDPHTVCFIRNPRTASIWQATSLMLSQSTHRSSAQKGCPNILSTVRLSRNAFPGDSDLAASQLTFMCPVGGGHSITADNSLETCEAMTNADRRYKPWPRLT